MTTPPSEFGVSPKPPDAGGGGTRPPAVWPGTNLPLRGFALLLGVGLFWGFNWPVMKIGMSAIPVFTFRGIVLAAAGLIFVGICRALGYSLRVPRAQWPALLAVTACISAFQVLSGYGVLLTGSGRAAVMAYTMPVWAFVLGAFILRERITGRKLMSLILGVGGMILLLIADMRTIGGAPIGMFFMLSTAFAWGLATVIQKRVAWSAPTLVLVTWQTILGAIPIYVGAAFVDYSAVPFPDVWPILAVVYNVVIASVFCLYAYFETVRLFPVAVTTIGVMLAPVVGVFSAAAALGEPLGGYEIGALVMVVAAIGLPALSHRRRSSRQSTP